MKKNGFTLVEITVCVVLLVTIFLLVVPKVNTMINNKKKNAYNSLISTVKDAAQAYVYLNVNIVDDAIESQGYYEVSIRTLQENELLENKLENPLTGKNIPSTSIVKIIKNNEEYIYKFSLDYQYLLEHIIDLYSSEETRISNGLKKDNTPDQNIRYYGSDPNNYVSFNSELWRIIGVFGNNVKLVRKDSLGSLSWDSSESSINGGVGINQWGGSKDADGNEYAGADLQVYLNKMYYGGTSVTCYGGTKNSTTTCPTNTLDNTAKALIDNHTWNTGAPNHSTLYNSTTQSYDTVEFYKAERGTVNGKICSSGRYCNDTVTRTTEWTGYIALPYVTDYAYASSENDCNTKIDRSSTYKCKNNNWMHRSTSTWYMSPYAFPNNATSVWYVYGDGSSGLSLAADALSAFPTIYLKSNVLIDSGKGTSSDPYILKAGL
jgi:competence protein ComGC